MYRFCLGALVAAMLFACETQAQVLFSYEDLDPDASSFVGNGLTITGVDAGGRTGVGSVDVSAATSTFMSLLTDPTTIDVSSFIGKNFNAFAESNIPTTSTINSGDSIFLQVDYFNEAAGLDNANTDTFQRFTAGFFNETAPRNQWLEKSAGGIIPEFTPAGAPVDRVNASLVYTDGGFGGTPNDSGGGVFSYVDNFSFTISEPAPPSPIFYENDGSDIDNLFVNNVIIEAATDPLDASNDVVSVLLGGAGTFVNVNGGDAANSAPFAGQKFRASVDYLVPSTTALEDGDDTFWIQLGFFDSVSESVFGGNNSDSAGFPGVAAVADDTWRTIEIVGTIPEDTGGAAFSFVISDDGFGGGPADSFGQALLLDNIIFEAIDRDPGDYNGDGVVNAADYTVWRDNLGTEPPTAPYVNRDATNLDGEEIINHNGDGQAGVDAADYTVWANNFGAVSGAPASSVPEPTAAMLVAFGLIAVVSKRASTLS